MNNQASTNLIQQALETGNGVLRLAPTWVPRTFGIPGRRLRLHADDLFALGADRGGISERWLSSAHQPGNGPGMQPDEGLSYIVIDRERVTLRDALAHKGEALIGREAMDKYGGWVMFSKLFDLMYPVPHHIHQDDHFAAATGQRGKPEAYYFPAQYNSAFGTAPYTWFGLLPGTTKGQLIDCLRRWQTGEVGDNHILALSRSFRLEVGTGWDVPPLILHAPGTLCTYEPQRASDVLCMWQSVVADFQTVDKGLLWKDVPNDKWGNYEFVVDMLDWEGNLDPDFKMHHFRPPLPVADASAAKDQGFNENWITYGNDFFSAKEISIEPGRTVTIRDAGAYGTICTQGYGRFGAHPVSAPSMIRYGQMTEDEFFVTQQAAREGVIIANHSSAEPLVMLKHFNPGNPEIPV